MEEREMFEYYTPPSKEKGSCDTSSSDTFAGKLKNVLSDGLGWRKVMCEM